MPADAKASRRKETNDRKEETSDIRWVSRAIFCLHSFTEFRARAWGRVGVGRGLVERIFMYSGAHISAGPITGPTFPLTSLFSNQFYWLLTPLQLICLSWVIWLSVYSESNLSWEKQSKDLHHTFLTNPNSRACHKNRVNFT